MENLDTEHYKGHFTFWKYIKAKYPNIKRPTKFCVIFSTWTNSPTSFSCTEYDTFEEASEEIKLINQMYHNTPKPEKYYHKNGSLRPNNRWSAKKYDWDFSDGKYFWGYVFIDMQNNKFLKVHNGIRVLNFEVNEKVTLEDYDLFFRGEDEISENYLWDINGEYDGWLQFRWGDRKNAVDYVEPVKKERPGVTEIREIYDDSTDTYIKKKVRVVYVDWNDPLPKKEKGIIYERPNKEPVMFPGEFGFEGDTSLWPWSLAEEVAGDEYCDKIGERRLNVEKNTTSSIADILGENNPLLKLKEKLS